VNRFQSLPRTAWAAAGVLTLLMGCSRQPPSPSADDILRAIYTAEWKWREDQFADDEDSQRPVVDHLPAVDPASQAARLKYWEDVIRRLDAIDRSALSAPERLNYDIYRPQIEVLIASLREWTEDELTTFARLVDRFSTWGKRGLAIRRGESE